MNEAKYTIQNQKFGVEIEITSITRRQAAEAVQSVVGGTIQHVRYPVCFDPFHITAPDQRVWKVISDSSLADAEPDYRVELVTPILAWNDLDLLQQVIRKLREVGAKASKFSGLHCHVSSEPHTPKTIRNLVKTFNRLENLLYRAVGVQEYRLQKYCKPNEESFVKKLTNMRQISDKGLNRAWFGTYTPEPAHYNQARYHALNISNLWRIHTIEFRFGEIYPKLHAGKIKAYIVLCLSLSAYALNIKGACMKPKEHNGNLKYALRVALIALKLVGPTYRNVRKHLLANLPGNSAWKNPKIKEQE